MSILTKLVDWMTRKKPDLLTPAPLPHGRVVEGPWTIQCVCPQCAYGTGYNEPFLASVYEIEPRRCKTCGLLFSACV